MDERLKELRKSLGLTQEAFSTKIGIKRNTLANYEVGRNDPIDAVLFSICSVFNVNEDWLRNGQGEMFVETEQTYLSELSRQYDLDELDQAILESYLALTKNQRSGVKDFLRSISKSIDNQETAASLDIDEEIEKYRQELEAEKKGEILSVSEDTKGIRRHARKIN